MDIVHLKKAKAKNRKFNEILLHVIDHSFMQIGKNMGRVVYYHLEKDFFVAKKGIPTNIESFSDCLKSIFGEGAQVLIEMLIVENLYVEIDENFREEEHYRFTDYVRDARRKYLSKK